MLFPIDKRLLRRDLYEMMHSDFDDLPEDSKDDEE
jgi:hypothetical protein